MMGPTGSAPAKIIFFDKAGKPLGLGSTQFLPLFLDWMPIDAKVFWFIERRSGDPNATHMLFYSQGEQRLVAINEPLHTFTYKELQERENGLEQRTQDYIDASGFSRVPRNQ